MKPRNVLWCPRGRHRLAWLEVDAYGEITVAASLVAPGRDHRHSGIGREPADVVRGPADDPWTSYAVQVTCACGDRWTVDLVAVLENRDQRLTRDTSPFPGVSWDRERR